MNFKATLKRAASSSSLASSISRWGLKVRQLDSKPIDALLLLLQRRDAYREKGRLADEEKKARFDINDRPVAKSSHVTELTPRSKAETRAAEKAD